MTQFLLEHPNHIVSEENPFHREIWSPEIDLISYDEFELRVKLCNSKEKRIVSILPMDVFSDRYTIIKGILPDGRIHQWLSESDGSAQRFRDHIEAGKLLVA